MPIVLSIWNSKAIRDSEVYRYSFLCLQLFQIVPSKANLSGKDLIDLDIANVLASDNVIWKCFLAVRVWNCDTWEEVDQNLPLVMCNLQRIYFFKSFIVFINFSEAIFPWMFMKIYLKKNFLWSVLLTSLFR